MKRTAKTRLNVSNDFDLFKAIIVQIEAGDCLTELMNWMVYDRCENLMEDAEIHTALYPENAVHYLMERRLMIYALLILRPKRKLDHKQKEQLMRVEQQLLNLSEFYAFLYNGL